MVDTQEPNVQEQSHRYKTDVKRFFYDGRNMFYPVLSL